MSINLAIRSIPELSQPGYLRNANLLTARTLDFRADRLPIADLHD